VPDKKAVEEKAAADEKGPDAATEAMPVEKEARKAAEPEEKIEEQTGDQPAAEAAAPETETNAGDDKKETPEKSGEGPLPDTEKK
jgi:hypothetical protein